MMDLPRPPPCSSLSPPRLRRSASSARVCASAARVVELGCSYGGCKEVLCGVSEEFVGIDTSHQFIAHCKEILPNARFKRCDACQGGEPVSIVPISIECFMEDIGVKAMIQRQDFLELVW